MLNFKTSLLQIFIFSFYLTGNADKSLFVDPENPTDVILPDGAAGPSDPTGPSRQKT